MYLYILLTIIILILGLIVNWTCFCEIWLNIVFLNNFFRSVFCHVAFIMHSDPNVTLALANYECLYDFTFESAMQTLK